MHCTYDLPGGEQPVVGIDLDEVRSLDLHAVLGQRVQVALDATRPVHLVDSTARSFFS